MRKFALLGAAVMAATLAFCPMVEAAEGMKVGVVNVPMIMQKAPQIKAIQDQLKKQYGSRQDALVKQGQTLQADMEQYRKDGAVMSATQKKALEDKIQAEQKDVESQQVALRQEVMQAQNQAMQGFLDKVNTAVQSVVKKNKLDVVIQNQATLYYDKALDVTDQVLTALGSS